MKIVQLILPLLFISLSILFPVCSYAQLEFIENKGQWDKAVDFKSEIATGSFYLQKSGFTVLMHHPDDLQRLTYELHGYPDSLSIASNPLNNQLKSIRSHAYRVSLMGASTDVQAIPEKALSSYNNYFIGDDKTRWQGNCKLYLAVSYKNIYPNIDIRYYTDQGTLKYDFIVHPGGDVNDIAMKFDGVDKLTVVNKELVIGTSVGSVKELYPYTYQLTKEGRETLNCKYEVSKNIVRFKIKEYNKDATIVIDPTIVFCSFTGSRADNWGYTATPGPDGSLFAGGIAYGSGYPTSVGAYSVGFNNGTEENGFDGYDIGIIKLSSNGRQRLYATYLGGSGNEQPHSLICDAAGNLVVAGRSNSANYPKLSPSLGGGLYDIVITKFNAAGSALIGSIVIGGSQDDGINIRPKFSPLGVPGQSDGAYQTRRNYGDDARSEVILDGNNNIYLASCTQSGNFPVRNTGIQNSFAGGPVGDYQQDGVILKFNPTLSSLLFSTFFGGTGNDACFVLSINPLTGNLYVGGATTSSDLPGNTTGSLSSTYFGGVTDGFVTELTSNGAAIIRTTYVGTNGNDMLYGIKFDKFGFPYITGTTTGSWPVLNAAYSNPGSKQFIAKLRPDLSAYVYSTVFGTASSIPNISITAFLVDRCQNVYVSGWGGGFNNNRGYPCAGTGGMPVTVNSTQSSTDGKDFYFFVLERDATSQFFGSFFGQSGGFDDHVDGGTSRFDDNGIIYQGVCANCGNTRGIFFPTTPGAWATTNNSPSCNQAAVKIEMNFAGVGASVKATINGVFDTVGCLPLKIKFIDTLAKGKRYIWDYGDGSKRDTTLAPNNSTEHTYILEGRYSLMLISIDSTTCNITDTAYITVKVGNNLVTPDFFPTKLGGCESLTFRFTNTSVARLPRFTSSSFLWDFGDNSPRQRAGIEPVVHTFPAFGDYTVRLIVDDTLFCNAPADTTKLLKISANVRAQFTTPATGCVPYAASFNNTSLGGLDFFWDFGDGSLPNPLKDNSPVVQHLYQNIGTYTIRLTALDSFTCNKRSDTSFTIRVLPIPTAIYSYGPNPAEENKPIFFTNASVGAVKYEWNFGDGEFSTEENPNHTFNASQTFKVCLTAINEAGCKDDTCMMVTAKILPLLDVPNAFTPGQFGKNGIVKVEGFGIGKMDWRIYNRWGQLIFSTSNSRNGWDGTFKGALQPMDVYTYTLDAEFTDGKKVRKTGDITLLR